MEKLYTVFREDTAFGTAEVTREGLYYRIRVCCPKPVRIQLWAEKGVRDLGICVPSANAFAIETRVPIKQIGEGEVFFRVEPEKDPFYFVFPDKPFSHLEILRSCVLAYSNGKAGVQRAISNPTGQWSEPKTSE